MPDREDAPAYLFPYGLPGFPGPRRFRLSGDARRIHLLEALEGDVRLPVVDPTLLLPRYLELLPDDVRRRPVLVRTVVVPDGERLRTNLTAPILLDPELAVGMQVVLTDRDLEHLPVGIA